MPRLSRSFRGLVLCLGLATAVSACGTPTKPSPELMGRCQRLYQLWARYETAHCPNQTGQRALAEWALSQCQAGNYSRGLAELEKLLRRDLIAIPAAEPPARP